MDRQNLNKFCKHIIMDKVYVVLVIVIFRKFATVFQPLIYVRIFFLFNILRMNGQNLTKFCIHIIIDKIYVAFVKHHFLGQIGSELWFPWQQKAPIGL